ncbi:MAG: flagellar basal body-associated protein FliL [Syntrophorhabdus sp. PtaU1.Bin002]|nr:MAG: flagellar basal body-associated protein FliL [Syntrophorhabdus sp. PtaB.Bin006]OPY65743.1 MAG: flagellar basal body-associated protein FliL [Syntrophorhabdus sp. PtaU1.Bin002]
MADEVKDKGAAEGTGEGDQGEQTPKKKGGKLKLFLILFAAIVVGGGAVGYFFFGKQVAAHYFGGPAQGHEKKKKEAMGPIISLEPFIFNVGGDSPRYAKIALGVELKDAKTMEEAKKMVPAMRDRVLSVLGTKGPDVLMDIKNRDSLKQELFGSLKDLFKESTELKSVYITDIIIQ